MRFGLTLAAWGLAATFATRASAEPDEGAKLVARELMAKGRAERDAQDFQGALASFSKAHAIMHVPTTLLEAARARVDVGRLLDALVLLRELPSLAPRPGEPLPFAKARADAVALAADLDDRVPRLSVDLGGSPQLAATTLWIDGVLRPDCQSRCRLDPGRHVIVALAPRAKAEEQLQLGERETQRLELVFSPEPALKAAQVWPATATTATSPHDAVASRPRVSALTWALSGVALAGLGTGTVLGLGAVSRRDELRQQCAPSCAQSDVDAVRRRATFANLSLGVGLCAAALAVTSYVAWRADF